MSGSVVRVLREMPFEVAQIIGSELRMGQCSACGEYKLVEKRDEYIADMDDACDSCFYYEWFNSERHMQGRPVTLTKASELCSECLGEFNDEMLDEIEKYK